MYYRLAQPNDSVHKRVFSFLRDLFRTSDILVEDSRKLKRAIETGSCTLSEWHPYSALGERASSRA
jgi:hypothetical protein